MCINAIANKSYHLGFGKVVAISTITRANENRSYKIYEEHAMLLIKEAKRLYIDATTIDLCLSTFFWATFRTTKAGIKLHAQIDLKTAIPEFIVFSNASVHDVNALDFISFEANSFYIMDKGYVDYKRLYRIHLCNAFFVTRAKDNMNYRRLYSHSKDIKKGVIYDQTIMLNNHYASKDYPEKLRIIKFKDDLSGLTLIFLTNNFHLKATDIALLYKARWDIEMFSNGSSNTSR